MAEYEGTRDWSDSKMPRREMTEAKADFRAGIKHLEKHHKEMRTEMDRSMMKKKGDR